MKRTEVIRLLTDHGLEPRQSLGQNFIIEPQVVKRIAELAAIGSADCVLEIGPGLGALTDELLARGAEVIAVEIDRSMAAILRERITADSHFRLVEADALKVDLAELTGQADRIKVCANLPYYITTALFVKILEELPCAESITLMMQKEAAQRLLSPPGTTQYGPASVLASLFGHCAGSFEVPPHAYYPQPGVSSRVIHLQAGLQFFNRHNAASAHRLGHFLANCFAMRRKTCWNNLREAYGAEQTAQAYGLWLRQNGLDERVRAEQITPVQFWQLFHFLLN